MKSKLIFVAMITTLFCYGPYLKAEQQVNSGSLDPTNDLQPLIFTAPPRKDSIDEKTYTPIVEFLSDNLQRKVKYHMPISWVEYNKIMLNDEADIMFDGPHFNSWRMNNRNHRIIVRLPEQMIWKVVTSPVSGLLKMDELRTKKACLQGSTNFGKLIYMYYFPNVMQQPEVVQVKSRRDGYYGLFSGDCVATILVKAELQKYNDEYMKNNNTSELPVKEILETPPFPNQAFSVSSRLSPQLRNKIRDLLLSPEGQQAMAYLRGRYANNKELIAAREKDYKFIDDMLKGSYPFDNPFNKPLKEAYSDTATDSKR